MYFVYKDSLNNVLSYTASYQNSHVAALPEADDERASCGAVEGTMASVPPPASAPTDGPGDRVWSGEEMVSVPEVEISAACASPVLAGRDRNVLPAPLVAVVDMEELVASKSVLFSVVRMLNDARLLPVAKI